jgi:hypothetical protein
MGKAMRDMRNSFSEDEGKKEGKPTNEGPEVANNAAAAVQNAPQSSNLQ